MTTVLVADDNAENRDLLTTLLGYQGFEVIEACDGAEALEVARRETLQLIVADVLMPRMDGYEFVRQLRADASIQQVPVVFYTASCVEEEWRALARSCGVEHVILKPCEPEEVLRVVNLALGGDAPQMPSTPDETFGREHLRLLADKLTAKIVESERVNSELRRGRETLALALEASEMGIWDWSIESDAVVMSERCRAILDVPMDAAMNLERCLHTVHPLDRSRIEAALASSLDQHGDYDIEYRIATRDGSERWAAVRGRPYYDGATGNPVRMAGTVLDISERHAAQSQIELALEEKTALLNEVHHRVKNNLQVVSSLLSLQQRHSRLDTVKSALAESQRRVKAMALIHQLLYERKDYSGLDLGEYLRRLCSMVIQTYSERPVQVRLQLELESIRMDLQRSVPYGLLVNELLTNSLKHAFPDGRPGCVTVSLHQLDESSAVLAVSDDGIGLPESLDLEHLNTLGLELVGILTDQACGKLSVRRSPGTRFEMQFPLGADE